MFNLRLRGDEEQGMELSLTKRLLYFSSGFAFVALPMLASSCAPQQDKNSTETPAVQGEAQPPAKPQMEQGSALNMELFHKWWAKAPYKTPERFVKVKGFSQTGFEQVLFLMREPKGACYSNDFPMASLIKEVHPHSPQCMNFDAKQEVASCDRKHGGDAMQQGCAETAVLSLELKAPKITVNKASAQEHGGQESESAGTKTVLYEYKMGTAAPKEPKFRLHLVGDEPSDLSTVLSTVADKEQQIGLPDHFVEHQVYSGHIKSDMQTAHVQEPLNTKPPWSMVLASLVLDSDKCTLAGGPATTRMRLSNNSGEQSSDCKACREKQKQGLLIGCAPWCQAPDSTEGGSDVASGEDNADAKCEECKKQQQNGSKIACEAFCQSPSSTAGNTDGSALVAEEQEPDEEIVAGSTLPAAPAGSQTPSSASSTLGKPVTPGQAGSAVAAAESNQKDWVLCEKGDKKIHLMPLVKKLRSQFQAPVAVSVVYIKGLGPEGNKKYVEAKKWLPKALERGVGELHKAYMEPAKWRHTAFKLKHKRNQIKDLKITLGTKELKEDMDFAWTAFYPHTLFIEHNLILQHPNSTLRISYTVTD